jgi:ankyrin repeat protein
MIVNILPSQWTESHITEDFMTPREANQRLFQAAFDGNLDDARAALAAGADPNVRDGWQQTPLHYAADLGHTDVGRLLIEKGAEKPDAVDKWQRTPLHYAARTGQIDVARLLIEKGADPNARDQYQQTPLHLAVVGGHSDLARLLIEKEADVSAKDSVQQTALNRAAAIGYIDLVDMLHEAADRQRGHAGRVNKRRDSNGGPRIGG